ncbi:MAG: hypothetical protein QM589_03395 [Thermomicrobiales bacterium]
MNESAPATGSHLPHERARASRHALTSGTGLSQWGNSRRRAYTCGALGMAVLLAFATVLAWGPDNGFGLMPAADASVMVFVIPKGASTSGRTPLVDSAIPIPRQIIFDHVDTATIEIRNDDVVTQRAGPWVVPAGQTFVQHFSRPGFYDFMCTQNWREEVMVRVGDVTRLGGH